MNEQLKIAYKNFKNQFLDVAAAQDQINKEIPADGERINITLKDRTIEVIMYRHSDPNAPTMFCSFGGGFVMGGCAMDNYMWKSISEALGCTIISIGYRRAPVHKFPNGLHDVYDTICYFAENAATYHLNTSNLIVFGASAGANLSTAAAILDNTNGTHYIKKQILNYPYLDLATDPEEKGHPMNEILMYYLFPEAYAKDTEELKNPLLSPVYATSQELKGMPETIMVCGENDALLAEGEKYLELLKENGVETHYYMCDNMEHGFMEFNYSLQYTPLELSFCSDATKEYFKSGKLKAETEKALQFIKNYL